MAGQQEILDLMHSIAGPCETIRLKAQAIAADGDGAADIRQASADLAAAIEHMFEVAGYIMKNSTASG